MKKYVWLAFIFFSVVFLLYSSVSVVPNSPAEKMVMILCPLSAVLSLLSLFAALWITLKKRIYIVLILLALLSIVYLMIRHQAVQSADRDSDDFFKNFSEATLALPVYANIFPRESDILILERHKTAVSNFSYQESTPQLNFFLNKAIVEVSWHLTIKFSRIDGQWFITELDEYTEEQ